MRFKVLDGKHQVYERDPKEPRKITVIDYPKGSIIECDKDLAARFNRPGCRKFERVADNVPLLKAPVRTPQEEALERLECPTDPLEGFEKLTKVQLIELAGNEGIEVDAKATKAEILETIRQALA